MTRFPNPLQSFATARPDHVAVSGDAGTWTAAEWTDTVARAAQALDNRGIDPGDPVSVVASMDVDFLRTWQALWWLGAVPTLLGPDGHRHLAPGERLLDTAHVSTETPVAPVDWALGEPRLTLLTSGSTAAPKRITLTTEQLLFSAFGSSIRLGHLPTDRWLCCLPLHHMGGLSVFWRAMVLQITAVLHRRFDPDRVSRAIDDGDVTLVSLVPDMLRRLLDARGDRRFPGTLRALLIGGERCPEALVQRAADCGAPIALTWGMTETASQVATRFPGDYLLRPDAGPPLPFVRLSSSASGRLRVEGPIAPGGAFDTSDHGRIDAAGRVVIEGRTDGVIISGGENLSPGAIEAALLQHPAVVDATVVGIADSRWGQRPAAWVASADTSLDADALRQFCHQRLDRLHIPDRFWVTPSDAVPRTETGKADRHAIRRTLEGVHA